MLDAGILKPVEKVNPLDQQLCPGRKAKIQMEASNSGICLDPTNLNKAVILQTLLQQYS